MMANDIATAPFEPSNPWTDCLGMAAMLPHPESPMVNDLNGHMALFSAPTASIVAGVSRRRLFGECFSRSMRPGGEGRFVVRQPGRISNSPRWLNSKD